MQPVFMQFGKNTIFQIFFETAQETGYDPSIWVDFPPGFEVMEDCWAQDLPKQYYDA